MGITGVVKPASSATRQQVMEIMSRIMEKEPAVAAGKGISPDVMQQLDQGLQGIPPPVTKPYGVMRDMQGVDPERPEFVRQPLEQARQTILENPQRYEVPSMVPPNPTRVIGQVPETAPEHITKGLGYYNAVDVPAIPYQMNRIMKTLQSEGIPGLGMADQVLRGKEIWQEVSKSRKLLKSLWEKITEKNPDPSFKSMQDAFVASFVRRQFDPIAFGRKYPAQKAFIDSMEELHGNKFKTTIHDKINQLYGSK